MTESFWKIPSTLARTPLQIMREQAESLTQATKGSLRGQVDAENELSSLSIHLGIVVPALGNYRVRVLRYDQPLVLYPGRLSSVVEDTDRNVQNESEFVDALKTILGSPKMQGVLGTLLAQAGAGLATSPKKTGQWK